MRWSAKRGVDVKKADALETVRGVETTSSTFPEGPERKREAWGADSSGWTSTGKEVREEERRERTEKRETRWPERSCFSAAPPSSFGFW